MNSFNKLYKILMESAYNKNIEYFCKLHSINPDDLNYLGSGDNGTAYSTGDGRVIKETSNSSEYEISKYVLENPKLMINFPIVKIFDVKQIKNNYYILMEELRHSQKIENLWYEMENLLSQQDLPVQYAHMLDLDELEEQGNEISDELKDFISIVEEMNRFYRGVGVEASDMSPENIGKNKEGKIVLFDFTDKNKR